MSAPEATGTRQRSNASKDGDVKVSNPTSLGTSSNQDIPRKKPVVKAPFVDVSMGRFLTYLVLGLTFLAAFYTWRFTVWAADVGGYWNLVTGHRNPPATGPGQAAMHAAASAASAASSKPSSTPISNSNSNTGSDADVQSQIYHLAVALGVKPADLSDAIRPLIDPSVPNPAEAARAEADVLKAKVAAQENGGNNVEGGSLLAAMGEALLD